ncbi:MAG: zinc-binding dehydrogenase [Chloroflexi bacterium]|nr:zinc-binding dehydrogenase [Chloroflexota bacterium]
MKAVLLYEHGPAEKLQVVNDHPVPEPGPGQVRVRVRAAALNYLDVWVRNGWPGIKLDYPHIPGADASGTVDALGAGVNGWQVGDRVAIDPTVSCGECAYCQSGWQNRCVRFGILGEHRSGTNAETIIIPARNLLALPDHVSFAEAAAASLVFVTAWHSLITRGGIRPGESVLIVGAGGGVNTASLQIAKLAGCTVYVIGSSDEKLAQARALGADHLVRRDVEGGWSRAIYQMIGKRGVDVVVDNVGAATLNDSLRTAARGGRILTVGNTTGPKVEIDNRLMFGKHLSLIGSTMGPHQDYVTVMNLLFEGKLQAVIGATLPLDEVQEAHRLLESGDVFGKIVLEV